MTSKRKLTNTHKEAIRRGVVTYHAKCKRCLSNNNRTKRIKELFERQKLRKQRGLSNNKKIYKGPSNNKRTKRIKELFERQKLRKQRWAALEARQKVRRNMVNKLTKKKS